jgi:hypothetical protein
MIKAEILKTEILKSGRSCCSAIKNPAARQRRPTIKAGTKNRSGFFCFAPKLGPASRCPARSETRSNGSSRMVPVVAAAATEPCFFSSPGCGRR